MANTDTITPRPLESYPVFLRVKDVAEILALTEHTVWNMIDGNRGPPIYKMGKTIRIRKTEFEQWLASRKRTV